MKNIRKRDENKPHIAKSTPMNNSPTANINSPQKTKKKTKRKQTKEKTEN